MLRLLLPRFDHVVLTRYLNNPRARSEQESLELANQTLERWSGGAARPELFAVATPQRALEAAKSLALKTGLICITGSFFLAAEVRPLLGTAD
jgi:dihydrofolate synthase/folylpolyglutamate synthase